MSWVKVEMSSSLMASFDGFRLQTQFEAIFMTAIAPREAAMFTNRDMTADHTTFFFSPKAAEIFSPFLAKWSPEECPAPLRDSVSLLVGHADAWNMLPPTAKSAG